MGDASVISGRSFRFLLSELPDLNSKPLMPQTDRDQLGLGVEAINAVALPARAAFGEHLEPVVR